MKLKAPLTALTVIGLVAAPSAVAEEDFESLCRAVSTSDGMPQEAIDRFCPCLAKKAAEDADVEAELRASVSSGADQATRLASVSEAAAAIVEACRAPE